MKKIILSLALLLALIPQITHARGSDNKRLGVGVNLGEPIGFDGRFYFTEQFTLDLVTGYGFEEKGFIVQPSLLFNLRNILDYDTKDASLVPYFGAGFKTGIAKGGDGVAALRFPVGATYIMKDGEFEVSLEFAPGVEFSPDNQFDITGGLGFRYYFW